MTLATIVLSLMTALAPHSARTRDGRAIAAAIVRAVSEDQARGYVDGPLEAAVMVRFAWDESRFQVHPVPVSWDARAGRVAGPWQLSAAYVSAHPSIVDQARHWLALAHAGTLSCVGPSARASRARLVAAWGLLERVTRDGVAEAQP